MDDVERAGRSADPRLNKDVQSRGVPSNFADVTQRDMHEARRRFSSAASADEAPESDTVPAARKETSRRARREEERKQVEHGEHHEHAEHHEHHEPVEHDEHEQDDRVPVARKRHRPRNRTAPPSTVREDPQRPPFLGDETPQTPRAPGHEAWSTAWQGQADLVSAPGAAGSTGQDGPAVPPDGVRGRGPLSRWMVVTMATSVCAAAVAAGGTWVYLRSLTSADATVQSVTSASEVPLPKGTDVASSGSTGSTSRSAAARPVPTAPESGWDAWTDGGRGWPSQTGAGADAGSAGQAVGAEGRLRIDGSDLCVDSGGVNPSPGQQLRLARCSGSDQSIVNGAYGSLTMNGLCFAPEDLEQGAGAPVILFECMPTLMDQQWKFRADGMIGSELQPELCITAEAPLADAVLALDTCTGTQNQFWVRE